jgi:hypothetical protein
LCFLAHAPQRLATVARRPDIDQAIRENCLRTVVSWRELRRLLPV